MTGGVRGGAGLAQRSKCASSNLIILNYDQVCDENFDLSKEIEQAYGPGGLGALAIRGIPGFVEKKSKFLPLAHTLGNLPEESLKKLEDEESLYNAGWSRGKEKLGDKPDFAKGSFYFNPILDECRTQEERERFRISWPPNLWPTDEIPSFEPVAKDLGTLMHETVSKLAVHIDKFCALKAPDYPPRLLGDAIPKAEKAKGRLLYYFPLDNEAVKDDKPDSWTGWHNDTGFLTALAGDCYFDHDTGEIIECPDENAGLYAVARDGSEIKIDIPKDCMAVQLGEACQIVSGGFLSATPHCVKGAKPVEGSNIRVTRASFPVFCGTDPFFKLSVPANCTEEQITKISVGADKVEEKV